MTSTTSIAPEEAIGRIRTVCFLVRALDEAELVATLEEIEREETLMPFLDPTLFMRTGGARTLGQFKGIVRALLALRREISKVEREDAER